MLGIGGTRSHLSNLGSILLEINSASHNKKCLFRLIFFRFPCVEIMTVVRKSFGHQPSSQGSTVTFYRGLFQRSSGICGVVSRTVVAPITTPNGLSKNSNLRNLHDPQPRCHVGAYNIGVKSLNVPTNKWIVRNLDFYKKSLLSEGGRRPLCIVQACRGEGEDKGGQRIDAESRKIHENYTEPESGGLACDFPSINYVFDYKNRFES